MFEMARRRYKYDEKWRVYCYRGKSVGYDYSEFTWMMGGLPSGMAKNGIGSLPIYPEHDEKYLKECIENLKAKGVNIVSPALFSLRKIMFCDIIPSSFSKEHNV